MNVFVLGTGRCGTMTFIRACEHVRNYTSGHETLSRDHGAARFDYPDDHIEADNRLTWFLPQLAATLGQRPTLYVHLKRDREATARSFHRRFDSGYRASIMSAFAHGMIQRVPDWPEDEQLDICRFYVDTVGAAIDAFLRDKDHIVVQLETAGEQFPQFLDRIGATGDLDAARAEWDVAHNAS